MLSALITFLLLFRPRVFSWCQLRSTFSVRMDSSLSSSIVSFSNALDLLYNPHMPFVDRYLEPSLVSPSCTFVRVQSACVGWINTSIFLSALEASLTYQHHIVAVRITWMSDWSEYNPYHLKASSRSHPHYQVSWHLWKMGSPLAPF